MPNALCGAIPLALLLAACGGSTADPTSVPACGWDLTTQAGKDANMDRLTFVNEWLAEHPGEAPPAPTSSYWLGECPTPTGPPPSAPIHEDEGPGD